MATTLARRHACAHPAAGRKQNVAGDPLVWCDCFRDVLPLSRKVFGATCIHCRAESGDDAVPADYPDVIENLQAELKRVRRELKYAEEKVDEMHAEISVVEFRVAELEEEEGALERELQRLGAAT